MPVQGMHASIMVNKRSSSVSVHWLLGARMAHRGSAGVHAALRLGLRHALHAVHAALILELAVNRRAAHLQVVPSTLKPLLACKTA